MGNIEETKLTQLLKNGSYIDLLNNQLKNIIDYTTLSYDIAYIPSENFVVNKQLLASPIVIEPEYMIEGNINSKEYIPPYNAFTAREITQRSTASFVKLLQQVDKMAAFKVYIRPYIDNQNQLSILKNQQGGGIIIRLAIIYQHDELKLV